MIWVTTHISHEFHCAYIMFECWLMPQRWESAVQRNGPAFVLRILIHLIRISLPQTIFARRPSKLDISFIHNAITVYRKPNHKIQMSGDYHDAFVSANRRNGDGSLSLYRKCGPWSVRSRCSKIWITRELCSTSARRRSRRCCLYLSSTCPAARSRMNCRTMGRCKRQSHGNTQGRY